MFGPRLVAKLVVLVLVLATVGSQIYSAIPKSLDSQPFDINFDGDFSIYLDENGKANVTTPNVKITSKLPQEMADIHIDAYLGVEKQRLFLGQLRIPSLLPNQETAVDFNINNLSVFEVLAAMSTLSQNDQGNIELPLFITFGFKYINFFNGNLIDFSLTIKAQTPKIPATVRTEDISEPNSKKVVIDIENLPGDSTIDAIISQFSERYDNEARLYLNDNDNVGFEVAYNADDKKITFISHGNETQTAVDVLKNIIKNLGNSESKELLVHLGSEEKTVSFSKQDLENLTGILSVFYGGN